MIIVVWARSYPKFHMALWCAIAVSWLVLGANSHNVPWGSHQMWILTNAIAAGAAFGVAYRRTASSMLFYLVVALVIGALRAVAYLANGSGGPAWVWTIIALTNLVLLGQWGARRAE